VKDWKKKIHGGWESMPQGASSDFSELGMMVELLFLQGMRAHAPVLITFVSPAKRIGFKL